MATFDFWKFRIKIDDFLFALINSILRLKYFLRSSEALKLNQGFKDIHQNQRAFIILNGPSLNKQHILGLQGEVIFFVNRAVKHKDYAALKPAYHVFVDGKMATGEWPLTFLDEAAALNPTVTFILNADWYALERFQPCKQKYKILWINSNLFFTPFFKSTVDLTKPMPGAAVFGSALMAAIYMGFREIYFTGFDGNGLCYEILNESSHFYGVNDENSKKTMDDYIRDLTMMSRNLQVLKYISEYCTKKGINVINLTEGGIINMFGRDSLENFTSGK